MRLARFARVACITGALPAKRGDHGDRYLGVKNSNKDTKKFLPLCSCLNLWCFRSICGRFRAVSASLPLLLFVIAGDKRSPQS